MIGIVILMVYIIGFFVSVPPIARYLLKCDSSFDENDKGDKVEAVGLAVIMGFFWPLVLVGIWAYRQISPKTTPVDMEKKA